MPAPATKKIRALLVYLALQRRTDVPRERLIETFWPDAEPDRARDSLKTALSSIRRSLAASGADPDAVLETSKSTVRWTAETSVDAEEFLALAAGAGEDARRNALQLYAGDFLDDDFQEWAVAERERIADAYEHLLIRLLRDDPDPELARRLLARNPFHEEAYAALIDAELLAGRSIAAAGHVERCRAALAELGASPSESFERRYGALRRPAAAELDVEFRLPFIGRDAAFATLRGAFADAARGTGSIVLVYGEPGIGKSSFLDRAAPLAATLGLRMITARGVQDDPRAFGTWRSIAEELTGHPLADVVRDAADPASAIVESVLGALHGPAVFFVDDVHWLHGDSLKATIALARTAAAAHVVLLSLRSEALTPVLAGLGDLPAIHVPLGYIGADETFAALRELIDAPPDLFLRNLYDRTKGHPLFLRSLLDSLVQSAALKRVGGVWKVLSADTKLALPPDLKRTIEARIRSAGDAATQVACALAVEPDARIEDLCDVLELDEDTVLEAVDGLTALGLIAQPDAGPRFAFAHDLVREVAGSLLHAGRRAKLHTGFARVLADAAVTDASLKQARHLHASGQGLAAAAAFERSAQEALEWHALGDAVGRASEGIAAIVHLDRTAKRDAALSRLHRCAAIAENRASRFDAAIERAGDAVAYARTSDPGLLADALMSRASALVNCFRFGAALRDAREATALVADAGDLPLLARAHYYVALALRGTGNYRDAVADAQRSYDIASADGDASGAALAAHLLFSLHTGRWEFNDACADFDRALEAYERLANGFRIANLHYNRAGMWYLCDRYDDAYRDLEAAQDRLEAAEARQLRGLLGFSSQNVRFVLEYMYGFLAYVRGDWDEALRRTARMEPYAELVSVPPLRNAKLMLSAEALLGRNGPGDVAAAAETCEALVELDTAPDTLTWSNSVVLVRARVAARLGRTDGPEQVERAFAYAQQHSAQVPLDADRAFEEIAGSAGELNLAELRARAMRLAAALRARRLAAAAKLPAAALR